ncbi:hypothetical protein LTS17_000035 [Exophiala oligosperma]
MLFSFLTVLGLAASTLADDSCLAPSHGLPPVLYWKWEPTPIFSSTPNGLSGASTVTLIEWKTSTITAVVSETVSTSVSSVSVQAAGETSTPATPASPSWAEWEPSSIGVPNNPKGPSSVSSSISTAGSSDSSIRPIAAAASGSSTTLRWPLSASTTLVSHYLDLSSFSTWTASFSSNQPVAAVSGKPQASTTSVSATSTTVAEATSAASSSSPSSASEVFIGLGTRYGGSCSEEDCWQNGACSFVDYTLPAGIDGSTCISEEIWNNGANCGGCISVTYKGKTITVMVTNLTGGNATHLDMTPDTWAKLTDAYSGGGVDGIEWEWVTCPMDETEPLWIRMHGGASKFWFAATVENARYRTSKLEVSGDGGRTWQDTTLDNYNIFVLDATLPGDTATVRVTSVTGSQVVVDNVALESSTDTKAAENYS